MLAVVRGGRFSGVEDVGFSRRWVVGERAKRRVGFRGLRGEASLIRFGILGSFFFSAF